MKQLKILVFNWQCIKNPLGGGAEVHFHEIFRRIADKGHSVTLFCCEFEGAPKEEVIDGIKVIRKGKRSTFNYIVKKEYKNRFSKEKFDIIIDDINKIPFYTPKYVKEPLMAISHHFFGTSIFREVSLISGLYVFLAEILVDFYYKKTKIAVVSQSTLDEFVSRGFKKENFRIIHNAIEQNNFKMQVTEKSPTPLISYFGRLKKYKSVDHLIKAFANIVSKFPDAKLDILGRGDFLDELVELSKSLKINEKITFHGFVTEEQKKELLSKSWAVVNTSMKEGWGITNIEANACGTLVVSANVQGLRDSVKEGESGLLYEYANIEQLTDHLKNIITDNDLREKLSNGAVEWAKTFSWDKSANEMLDFISEIIGNN